MCSSVPYNKVNGTTCHGLLEVSKIYPWLSTSNIGDHMTPDPAALPPLCWTRQILADKPPKTVIFTKFSSLVLLYGLPTSFPDLHGPNLARESAPMLYSVMPNFTVIGTYCYIFVHNYANMTNLGILGLMCPPLNRSGSSLTVDRQVRARKGI